MDIEEAEERLKKKIEEDKDYLDRCFLPELKNKIVLDIKAIETVLSELEKKDKVINEMAEYIKNPYTVITFGSRKPKTKIIREYFTNKVEREGK